MQIPDFFAKQDSTAPGFGSKTVTPHNTDPIWSGECARALEVLAAGTVVYKGVDSIEDYYVVTSGMVPFRIDVAVTHVLVAGTNGGPANGQTTTVAAGSIKAIR